MNISGELLAELGRTIQNDWYERSNMLASSEKNLWETMNQQETDLSATMLSWKTDDLFTHHILMFRNLYTDLHELAFPFSSRNSGGADESEMAPDTLSMPSFSSITGPKTVPSSNTQAKPAENPVANLYPAKFSSIDPDTTKAATHPSITTERKQYSNPDAKWDGHSRGHTSVEPEHKDTRQDDRKTSDFGKTGDGYLQNPTEDQAGNHTEEKRTAMGSLHPEKFTEVKGWNQLGEIFQNVERDRPGFYLNDEELPDGSGLYPPERSGSENRVSEWNSTPNEISTDVGKLSADPLATSATEEPGIQEVPRQLPAEVDFEGLFTEMQWRLNLEYKRYYGH
jgi:hypothetical protein